ncbi:MAG: hypothetical protein E2594_17145 [Pseudomonas sp.]|nr:hypothetical protein [Pseudomonas sp.]
MSDIPNISLSDLTEASLKGNGVFDVLMRASKAHLDEEFTRNRIKGAEYAQVYLGSLTQILQTATQFLLEKDRSALQAKLIEAQVKLAEQQALNAVIEGQNLVLQSEILKQQALNAEVESRVMEATICKLKAEYDLILEQRLKTTEETGLLAQKKITERAQTVGAGVDDDSVVGRQKMLYKAQTDGFQRDAEQKTAKTLIDTWNVRRTTDDATVADGTNMLNDATIGRAVSKLLAGVGA